MVCNHDTHSLFKCVCLSFSNLVESKHIVCYCKLLEKKKYNFRILFCKSPTSYRKFALISVIFIERFGLVEDFQSSEENNFGEPCIHYPSRVTVIANIIKWTHILLVILSDKPIHCLSFSLMVPCCLSFSLTSPYTACHSP